MLLTRDLLAALAPRPRSRAAQKAWDGYVNALTSQAAAALFSQFGITTKLRMAHLLANWAHETGGFTIIWESGAYSASRIMQIFGQGKHSAGVTPSEAKRLAYNGPALFDRVYGIGNPRKCKELGNDQPGDGWRYRGCGIVQITGKRDHYRYSSMIGIPANKLSEPIHSIHAALLEWKDKDCSKWADRDDTVKVRKLINGGRNGLQDVRVKLAKVKRLLANYEAPDAVDDIVEPDDGKLRIGSTGPQVEWLETQLTSWGYFNGKADGDFGRDTEAALIAWQVQQGFEGTGVYDPNDAEMREALGADPRPKDVPVRDITKDDLKDRGSETVNQTSWWKKLLAWLFGANFMVAADDISGTGQVDQIISKGEEVKSLAERTSGLMSYLPDTKFFIIIAIALGLFVLYRAFNKIENRRVEDAQTGANLGR